MNYLELIIPFVGGLGMFIYGMQIMAQGLENAAGNKLKTLLEALTKNMFMGVLLGAAITAIIQSSSATTVMVVGFVNAGIMNLKQATGIIMGANIGTTITGWLVSSAEWAEVLSPDNLAPIAIMVGVVIMLVAKKSKSKDIAEIIIGFGLLFIGISTMSESVSPLKESEMFCSLFVKIGENPILGILVGTVVTAIIQSSSASVGILQSLAAVGLVPFNAAIYIIMGQNIGTCVTSILSAMGAKKEAKTAAVIHLLFNVIGTIVFSILSIILFQVFTPVWSEKPITQTEISFVHTVFNIATTIMLFPVATHIIKLAKKIGRVDENESREDVLLLDDRMLETPGIALSLTVDEVNRMGGIVADILDKTKDVLFTKSQDSIKFIRDKEQVVDKLSAGITDYAIKITTLNINEEEHTKAARLLQVVSDMERVSDYCENISEFAEALIDGKMEFSKEAAAEIEEMVKTCFDSYNYAYNAFREMQKDEAMDAIALEAKADLLESEMRKKHINRLATGKCNVRAGIVYLDTLVCLERISDHGRNIAQEVLR